MAPGGLAVLERPAPEGEAACRRQRSQWPPERIERLRKLFHDDGLSHGLIAADLRIAKGAVSAKLDRLGWTRTVTKVTGRLKPEGENRPSRLRPPTGPVVPGLALDLLQLNATTCRYPTIQRAGDWLFCGEATGGRTYCPDHHARCFQEAKPK